MATIETKLAGIFLNADDLWNDGAQGLNASLSQFTEHCTKDFKCRVIGQEFQLAGEGVGLDNAKAFFTQRVVPTFLNALDINAPKEREVTLIANGGPGEWSVVEIKGKGTSKKGQPWVQEAAVLLKSNDEGKWTEIKFYMDTLHIQNHILQSS
ncbi:hypothetical protein F5B18DRAFT_637955, partial [Nemania serpens]